MDETTAPSNATEISVSELSTALKRTVEDRFGFVRVRGEVSGYRGPHSSGHVYFALKDQSAKIDAVMWKGVFGRLRVKPEEGMEVIATGKITTYPGKSSYQIVIEMIEPAGVGALMALLEERRRKLAAEGLFDDNRKQLLPFLPKVIGVVTSPTGAVIRDILHRLEDRFPVHVLVWPVRVQGETSAQEVADAIIGLNELPIDGPLPRPDVIIVARGGGSLEDLWGFNEEMVVRAAAQSLIPLISAVGHETDWTLIDHAADLRAPTPTAAAEMCVPVRSDLLAQSLDLARRLNAASKRLIENRTKDCRNLARHLPAGEDLSAIPRQRLDRDADKLTSLIEANLNSYNIGVERLARRLLSQSPQARMARAEQRLTDLTRRLPHGLSIHTQRRQQTLDALKTRLSSAMMNRISLARQSQKAQTDTLALMAQRLSRALTQQSQQRATRLTSLNQLLTSLSYRNVLARGFALVRDEQGAPIHSSSLIAPGHILTLEFADGQAKVTSLGGDMHGGDKPAIGKPSPAPRRKPKGEQADLF